MVPDPRDRRRKVKPRSGKRAAPPGVRTRPSSEDAHQVVYFKRHPHEDPGETAPGQEFLPAAPASVRAKMRACLNAVAAAPPKRFAGGGHWEAMHGSMTGWFEIRYDGPKRHHYRLFCRLDYEAQGVEKPLLVIIAGKSKAFRTKLSDADYEEIRRLGDEHLARNPRSLA